ncbi:MAG: GNAT family N-acetyltransferase [Chloroflexota bacterium]
MELIIRPVREEDAGSIVELLNPIIQAGIYTAMDESFSVTDQLDFMRSFPQRGIYQIALDGATQKILGIQDVLPISTSNVFRHVGEVSTFVALDAHRQGVGQSLCQATFKAVKVQDFLKLRATVRGDNPYALAFYQSQGFELIGIAKQHAYLRGKYIDEILLEKFLE